MLLEGGHSAHHALVIKVRHRPLQGFFDLRATGVDHLSQVLQDRLGEWGGLGDVSVYSGIFLGHGESSVGFRREYKPAKVFVEPQGANA
jgi:hypothetical protein